MSQVAGTQDAAGTAATDAVAVGVDGSEPSRRALAWAAQEALRRGVALRVVHAFPFGSPSTSSDRRIDATVGQLRDTAAQGRDGVGEAYGAFAAGELLRTDADRADEQAHAMVSATLAPWQERHPDVEVRQRVRRGQIVSHLAQAFSTDQAEVVVVGARGRTALAGMVLGSVSQGLLHHTEGSVVVVR